MAALLISRAATSPALPQEPRMTKWVRAENILRSRRGKKERESEKYMDRSAVLRATLNSLAMMNVANVINSKKKQLILDEKNKNNQQNQQKKDEREDDTEKSSNE